MLLPSVLYGPTPEVKQRMRPLVKKLVAGANLIDVVTAGGMLDTSTTPGLLLLDGVTKISGENFHTGLTLMPLIDALSHPRTRPARSIGDAIFEEALGVPWGILGMLGPNGHFWLMPETRFRPFLDATLRFWGELDAVGARYCYSAPPRRLWDVIGTLHFVLANLGVPQDRLRAPLPPGGPGALLKYAHAAN
jgi:hypothetical protein